MTAIRSMLSMFLGFTALTLSAFCQTGASPSEYKYSGSFSELQIAQPAGNNSLRNRRLPQDQPPQLCYVFDDTAQAPIQVGRVVATSSSDIDASGTLLNAPLFVANHIISAQATLEITYQLWSDPVVAPPPPGPSTVQVLFDGQLIGSITAEFASAPQNPPLRATFQFDIGLVKFALKGSQGSPPQPGFDGVGFANASGGCVDDLPTRPFGTGPHTTFITATLRFKALSPVLMVHGYNEGPEWFGPPASDQCTPGGFNFFQAFDQAKIPYDYQEINLGPGASILQGGPVLAARVSAIATEFGAKHVHLIGHSKGGLFIRQYLPRATDNDIGVFSVTTLETPHHGSYGADVITYSHRLFGLTFANNFLSVPQFIIGLFGARAGARDLTVANMELYNSSHPFPPTSYAVDGVTNSASFYSAASDADLNNDGTITANEVVPFRRCVLGAALPDVVNTFIFNSAYQSLRRYQRVQLALGGIFAQNIQNTPPAQNDFAVTTASATYDSFQPISANGSDVLKYNHNSVGNPDPVGNLVIEEIHNAEPIE